MGTKVLGTSRAGKIAPKAKQQANRPKAAVPAPKPQPKPIAVDRPGASAKPSAPAPKKVAKTASEAAPAPKAAAPKAAVPKDGFDRALTPAEAMHGLSGKQLEAFQMVMTRMERLERENQELMQILLQMQTLLQQQQQRNARLTQIAGHSVSGSDQS